MRDVLLRALAAEPLRAHPLPERILRGDPLGPRDVIVPHAPSRAAPSSRSRSSWSPWASGARRRAGRPPRAERGPERAAGADRGDDREARLHPPRPDLDEKRRPAAPDPLPDRPASVRGTRGILDTHQGAQLLRALRHEHPGDHRADASSPRAHRTVRFRPTPAITASEAGETELVSGEQESLTTIKWSFGRASDVGEGAGRVFDFGNAELVIPFSQASPSRSDRPRARARGHRDLQGRLTLAMDCRRALPHGDSRGE